MAKNDSEKLKKACAYHDRVVEEYDAKSDYGGFACYRTQSGPYRVFRALYDNGGGLTPDELFRASGVATREQFDIIVRRMKRGTDDSQFANACNRLNMQIAAMQSVGGMIDYKKINEEMERSTVCMQIGGADSCMVEEDGKLYLWCQKDEDGTYRHDVLATFQNPSEDMRKCEEKIADAQSSLEKIVALEKEQESLKDQVKALGFFDVKQKQPLKKRLAEVRSELAVEKEKNNAAEKAKKTLQELYDALESF